MRDENQISCYQNIENIFYKKDIPTTDDELCKTVSSIIDSITTLNSGKKQTIYIGITHHPCGRYTADYETIPLNPKFGFNYQFENLDKVEEGAHQDLYNKMYIIFSHSDFLLIKELERRVIECAKKCKVEINNKSIGGEGDKAESELYFLYICTSRIISN